MSWNRCLSLTSLMVLFLAGEVVCAQTPATPAEGTTATEPASLHPKTVYPQIVRLSLVEGDVRVAVGKQKGQPEVAPWVQAAVNMPIESGFSVVTGKGRAEIEFEDASTMYVGENSALTFDELTTKNGVPYTDMMLLSGVASLHLRPMVPGERYDIATPTDALHIPYGSHTDVRVNSYTDAMTITPLAPAEIHLGDVDTKQALVGKTFTYSHGVFAPTPANSMNNFAELDQWVAARVAERGKATHAVMKEAGLKQPLPGMADMNARGRFFECQPYGTCWEPTNGWAKPSAPKQRNDGPPEAASAPAADAGSQVQQEGQPKQAPPTQQQLRALDAAQNGGLAAQAQMDEQEAEGEAQGGVAPALWMEDDQLFPCSPYSLQSWMALDPMTGAPVVLASNVVWDDGWYSDYGFDWAVCHAGSWVYWNHRYAWVAGNRRHHQCPVHWVKVGGKLGYVPIHPHDREGKDPENLKHGIFVPADRKGQGPQRVAYEPGARVKLLAETPKEFRSPQLPALHAATAPTLEARSVRGGVVASKGVVPTSSIAFDSKGRGFTVTAQVNEGGRSHTEVSHFSASPGNGGGHGFGGGNSGGAGGRGFSGGGAAHASGGGASSTGGGFHGGGSSGGGGGSSTSAGGGSHGH